MCILNQGWCDSKVEKCFSLWGRELRRRAIVPKTRLALLFQRCHESNEAIELSRCGPVLRCFIAWLIFATNRRVCFFGKQPSSKSEHFVDVNLQSWRLNAASGRP